MPDGLNIPVTFPDGTDVLPKGAKVEITDSDLVPLKGGEDRAYKQLTYSWKGDRRQPGHTLVFEVWKGQIVCTSALFASDPERGRPVLHQDIKALSLQDIGYEIYGWVGVWVPNPDAPGQYMRVSGYPFAQRSRKRAANISKTRDLMLLDEAAHAYRTAPDGSSKTERVRNIALTLNKSERTAWRYYEKCVEAGLIDE